MASRAKSRTLTDHEKIRRWAEERGARPSTVKRTHSDDNTGIIRLDFPGYSGENSLEEISWDEWFEDFDDRNLALIVQDETADGEQSNFNKLVSRESVESDSENTSATRKRRTSSRANASRTSQSQKANASRAGRGASAKKGSTSRSSGSKSHAERKTTGRGRSSGKKAA